MMNDAILWLYSGHHAAAIAGALSLACFFTAGRLVYRGGAVAAGRL